jgi:proteasome lid subunit RPN8/RPN11
VNLRIRVRGSSEDPVPLLPPGERAGTRIVESGRRLPPSLTVYVNRHAYDGMLRRAAAGDDFEVGGFLLGGFHHHAGRRYVDITHQVPALKAESARAHLTFSNDAMREFHETHAERYPGTLVLGWYHTHPGSGLFLSADDRFIQKSFYASDHHVAIVIDPHAGPREAGRIGVFVWEEHHIYAERPYSLVVYDDDHRKRSRRQKRQ